MAGTIKIISLNCRGLRDSYKRKDMFDYLHSKNYNIYCLQDTHFTEEDENIIRSQWGYDCYISPGRSNARGVAVLFNNNFEHKVLKKKQDAEGNYIMLNVEIEKKIVITLVNIYGPNADDREFYEDVLINTVDMDGDHTIICADWNLVQDFELDCYNYVAQNNIQAVEAVGELKHHLNLVDPWRIYNPNLRRYTWFRKNPIKKARLDFFLISEELMSYMENTKILPGYKTDHSMVLIEIRLNNFVRGRGFWRFNNSLLKDPCYINKVKEVIQKTKEDYAIPIYVRDMIKDMDPTDLQFIIDDQMFFEMVLLNIRGMTIPYCAAKKRRNEERKKHLEEQLELLHEMSNQLGGNNQVQNGLIEDVTNQLEEFRKEHMKGVLVRSRARWIEEGERPSRYFCGLEKRNFVNKNIIRLVGGNGGNIIEQKDILQEVKTFYMNLYSCKDKDLIDVDLEVLLQEEIVPKLDTTERDFLETPFTLSELSETLKGMKNDKSPGPDGYTVEFYKVFWLDLKCFLHRSFLVGKHKGELSITQKQGVISIIPKGDKPREFLKNWRPISLLNVSYKMLSGCIAQRIKKVLDGLIHENQKGFLKNRYIGENTRLVYDLMQLMEEKNLPGLLLLIDFEKAFDSVSWNFIDKTLAFFNFGPTLRNLVKLLYRDAKLCVIQHGIFSEFFAIGRGVRQGDPLSPYLFTLCVEIMSIMMRNSQDIRGVVIGGREYKLFQYADDTGLILDGSEKSLLSALHLLDQFAKYSGLTPNLDKTKCIWLGSKMNSQEILCAEKNLSWTNEPFVLLGIKFSTNIADIPMINYDSKLGELTKLISTWSKRQLSPLGKIVVIKSIILPKLTHLFVSLPKPSPVWLKKLEKMLFHFIWNHNDRIARAQLIQDYSLGGLRMVHIESFIKSMKLSWIQRFLCNSNTAWANLLEYLLPGRPEQYFQFGNDYLIKTLKLMKNSFWKEVLECLLEFRGLFDYSKEEDLNHSIWYNSNIQVGNHSVFFNNWYQKGIHIISDLLNQDGHLMNYEEFRRRYIFSPMITRFYGLRCAILENYTWLFPANSILIRPICPKYLYSILNNGIRGKKVYDFFIEALQKEQKYKNKWATELDLQNNDTFWKQINIGVKSPMEVQLQWFQYRIIHRIIGTNSFLYKIGLSESPLCTFCGQTLETILHLFWECPVVGQLIHEVKIWLGDVYEMIIELTGSEFILGRPLNRDTILNLALIILKYHIYKQKLKNCRPNLIGYKKELVSYYKLEQYIYTKNLKGDVFHNRWEHFHDQFE